MKVAIGIPTYNQKQFVQSAVDSCLQQTYSPKSILIGDDQSTDGTDLLFSQIAPGVTYIRNTSRLGRLGNYRNLLYKESEGAEWYVNLDGDDYFSDQQFIKYAIDMIGQVKEPSVVFFQGNQNLNKIKKLITYKQLDGESILVKGTEYFLAFPRIMHFIHCATIFNRQKALPLNFYSFDCLFSDFHSMSRLALTGNVILSSKKVAVWRQHDNNATGTLNEQSLQNEIRSIDDIGRFAEGYLSKEEVNRWVSQMGNYYRKIFIYQKSTVAPGIKSIGFILKHWRSEVFYFKFLAKNIVLMMAKPFRRN
jgi:glycosyltransferase involved in cell wall biosynthesis